MISFQELSAALDRYNRRRHGEPVEPAVRLPTPPARAAVSEQYAADDEPAPAAHEEHFAQDHGQFDEEQTTHGDSYAMGGDEAGDADAPSLDDGDLIDDEALPVDDDASAN